MPRPKVEPIVIRPDKDPSRTDRVTVVFAEDTKRKTAIEGLTVLQKAFTGSQWGYSIPLSELPSLLALPQFRGVQPSMELMSALQERQPAPRPARRAGLPRFPLPEGIDLAEMPGGRLRDWQVEDLYYVEAHDGLTVVGHTRGVGKTPVGLGWAYHQPELRPAIFVVPANVKRQWLRMSMQWLGVPEGDITVIQGRKKIRPETPIIIINWDILSTHVDELMAMGPRLVIYDELARGKNMEAQRTKRATLLAHFSTVSSRLGLTGTEYMNRPDEGWPQDHIINPAVFPNRWQYRMRYCNPLRKQTTAKRDENKNIIYKNGEPEWNYSWDVSGASNVDELNRIRRERLFIRRTKKDVRPDSPDPIRETIPLEVDLKEYRVVERQARQNLLQVRQELQQRRLSLKGLSLQQQQKAIAEHAEKDSLVKLYGVAWSEMSELRKASGRAKVSAAAGWCRGFLEEEVPLLLFAHHHEVSDELVERLNKTIQEPRLAGFYPDVTLPRALDGRMTQKRRDAWADKFIDGGLPILPAGLMAMSEGYDGLQHRASHLAIMELGWNPSTHDQAEGRLDREGQEEQVNCYYLVAVGTFDDDMIRVCDAKNTVVSASYGEVPPPGIIESLLESYLS